MSKPVISRKPSASPGRGRPREFDTQTVLACASEVFWNHGYHATSVDDLCKATGVLRGSLYGVFGDKHGLLLAALDHYADGSIARLAERLSANVPPEEALRNALMHHARAASALNAQRSCFITNATLEMSADDIALRERIESIQRRTITLLSAAVIRGQASGAFNATLDEKSVGEFLLCITQGLRVLGKTPRDEQQLTSIVDLAMRALV